MPPARRPNTAEFKGVSYLLCHGPIVYAVRIVQLSILKMICGKLTKICLLKVAKFYSRLYSKRHKLTAGRTNVCEPLSALRSFIFARWSSLTSKLGKFINFKVLFVALSTDLANWSFIYKNLDAVKGCFLCDCDTTQMLTVRGVGEQVLRNLNWSHTPFLNIYKVVYRVKEASHMTITSRYGGRIYVTL